MANSIVDTSPFDADGQASFSTGTWSFDTTVAAVLAGEINVAAMAIEINVGVVTMTLDAAALSVSVSFEPVVFEAILVPSMTIEYTPYADAAEQVLVRHTQVGAPGATQAGVVNTEEFFGQSAYFYGIESQPAVTAYQRTCRGDSRVETTGTHECKSGTDLSLSCGNNLSVKGQNQISLLADDGKECQLTMKKSELSSYAKDTKFAAGNSITLTAPTLNLLGQQKVTLDAGAPEPPPAPPSVSEPVTAEKEPSSAWTRFWKGVGNRTGWRTPSGV